MSIELKMLTCSAILGLFQLLFATHLITKVRGLKWNLSPRDEKMPELTGVPARLDRAYKNFMETFVFFIVAVFVVQHSGSNNVVSATGAYMYFFGRLIYVPLYAKGVIGLRTAAWACSLIGIVLVFLAPCIHI
jgi:uncharacterized MAPEG superfamily protein